jgi:hypothetical protein
MRLFVCALLFVYSSAYTQEKQPVRVLFIGNSYTHMNSLYKIYQNLANSKGKNVKADTLAVSGSTLKGHTERPNTFKKIKSKNWDYVFIQGFSRELSYDANTISQNTVPYARMLIDSIQKYNPCVSIYYYMTWGYADGYKDSIPTDSYLDMQERIQKGYLQLSQETGGFPIAPVGMVWKKVRELHPEMNLYVSDKAHPSILGSYVAACTFFSSIYKESPEMGRYPKKINYIDAQKIQKQAADYTLTYFPLYNLDSLQIPKPSKGPGIKFFLQETWLSVTCSNKTSGGEQYFWDFGDGHTSSMRSPKHYYSKPGKYTVTLYVKSKCNWYTLKKSIKVSDKVKFGNSPVPNKN